MENKETRRAILNYIERNSKANLGELAIMLGTDEVTVANEIAAMEKEKIICGYHTIIDWDKAGSDMITALIEVRVTPQRDQGFDKIAERIYKFPEVTAVYLISGSRVRRPISTTLFIYVLPFQVSGHLHKLARKAAETLDFYAITVNCGMYFSAS